MEWLAGLFKTLVGWFPDKYKMLFALSLVAGLFLLPGQWKETLHVAEFSRLYAPWLWIIFLFGSTLLILSGCQKGWATYQHHAKLKERLDNLTRSERETLRVLLAGTPVIAWPHEDRVVFLFRDGVLWREETVFGNGQYTYGIQNPAQRKLMKNPSYLG